MGALMKANDSFIRHVPCERHCHLEPLEIQPDRGDVVGHQSQPNIGDKNIL